MPIAMPGWGGRAMARALGMAREGAAHGLQPVPHTVCVRASRAAAGPVRALSFRAAAGLGRMPGSAAVRALSSPAAGGGGGGDSPLKDPAIAAAIEQARAAQAAAKPDKFGRSLTETLRDHRDELFNIFLAALLVVLTLKMLREKVRARRSRSLLHRVPACAADASQCAPCVHWWGGAG